jgi:hypothetical protein
MDSLNPVGRERVEHAVAIVREIGHRFRRGGLNEPPRISGGSIS